MRLVLAVALLYACDNDRDHFFTVFDPCEPLVLEPANPTDEQSAAIADAIELWRAVTPVGMTLEPAPDARTLPIVFEETKLYLGYYDDLNERIHLATRVNDRAALAVVLAHELGHAFDLYHVDDRDSVMNEGNWEIPPLASDAAELEAKWGTCPNETPP